MNKGVVPPSIIDIEASGFGSHSYPIEIGVITGGGRRFCRLIKPMSHWNHWDEQAESLHQITRESLDLYGMCPKTVCVQLNAFLCERTVYSDGWTVDSAWMQRLFADAGVHMTFRVSPLELILSEQQMMIWHKVKDTLMRRENRTRHRASNDAKLVQATFNKTREMVWLGQSNQAG